MTGETRTGYTDGAPCTCSASSPGVCSTSGFLPFPLVVTDVLNCSWIDAWVSALGGVCRVRAESEAFSLLEGLLPGGRRAALLRPQLLGLHLLVAQGTTETKPHGVSPACPQLP